MLHFDQEKIDRALGRKIKARGMTVPDKVALCALAAFVAILILLGMLG